MSAESLPSHLARLADAVGVATGYDDYLQRPVQVGAEAVRLALAAMGIDAGDEAAAQSSIEAIAAQRRSRVVPPSIVLRPRDSREVALTAPAESASLTLEDGSTLDLRPGELGVALPDDLPLGYHRLVVDMGSRSDSSHVIVTPGRCPLPLDQPSFGWMAQLYAAISGRSWGMGDCRDLAALASWSGGLGAAMILVNPLHATAPVTPQESSPYSPTSRRYRNPLYLRIEDIAEYATLDDHQLATIAGLAEQARRAGGADRIDRDAIFHAKNQGLELLAAAPRSGVREQQYRTWRDQQGQGLVDFTTFCALAERHGMPWQQWPEQLRRPDGPAVAAARAELHDRVEFHSWLQWLCDEQLAVAQTAARDAGMTVGIVHDLAVGVDPGGADAWALQDEFASGVTVGAPPDGFNQRGQDWALPPLLPGRLAETGYTPFRDMIRSVLRHAGGIRIDHVMGLWRLWWVPQGRSAADGTYVTYPARDLLGVLALEAHRAGALVVGEDLGTVQKGVRETMAEHRMLSSRVMYFERIDDDPDQPMLPAADYPELALTSITTHDLPTAAGWWADEDVKVQTELSLYGESTTPQEQQERKAGEREDMLRLLRGEGLVGDDPAADELILAMHRFLARTPCLLVASGLGDALGDRRQPNLPGTIDQYPNWRMPLARWSGGAPQPVTLEEVFEDPRVRAAAAALVRRAVAPGATA